MPNCYQLLDKETGNAVVLQHLDDEMWRTLGKTEPDPEKWYFDWHNWLGFSFLSENPLKISEMIFLREIEKEILTRTRKSV